jgi:putative transposase
MPLALAMGTQNLPNTFGIRLTHKSEWYGRTLVVVDRWFPSSKRCSGCGLVASKMPLSVRSWVCAGCGVIHDRDVNSAINIRAAGHAVLVCGDDVRPTRVTVDAVICEAETT